MKKYDDYDNIEYKGIRDICEWMKIIINQIQTNSSFNDNYIEYERKGDKNKTLSIKKYLNMIKTYLRDMINDHKPQG